MSKKIEKQIDQVKAMATVTIPAIIGKQPVSVDEYNRARMDMNMEIIKILIGADFDEPKDGKDYKVKFNRKLPSRAELAELVQVVDVFTKTVEAPFMVAVADSAINSHPEADMGIPPKEEDIINAVSCLPKIEKINSKKLKNYIFGKDGHESIANLMLNAADCMSIAAMGEDLRKKTNRNTMLLIGGIALLITGGTVAAVCIRNSKKNNDDIDMDDIGDIDIDLDEGDMPNVSLDDDTTPIVTID